MKNFPQSFKRPLASVRTATVVLFLIVALVGFADSAFLTIEHYRGSIPPCTIEGCDTVLTSPYATFADVPVALFGSLYYLAIAIGAFIYLEARHGGGSVASRHSSVLKWTFWATAIGFVMSLYFLYLQAFVIGAWCQYCLGSAATSTILFVIGMASLSKRPESDTHDLS